MLPGKRIAAVVLPDLPVKLVRRRLHVGDPLGVVLEPAHPAPVERRAAPIPLTATLDAVDAENILSGRSLPRTTRSPRAAPSWMA